MRRNLSILVALFALVSGWSGSPQPGSPAAPALARPEMTHSQIDQQPAGATGANQPPTPASQAAVPPSNPMTIATSDPAHEPVPTPATAVDTDAQAPYAASTVVSALASAAALGPGAPTEPSTGPRLAILNYHEVDDRYSNAYTVSTAQLASHIEMLLAEGYTFYQLADVERLLAGDQTLPERGVLLAFDDGYSSFYSRVMPLARKYNVPATCFIVTKYLEEIVIVTRPHMSNSEIRELAESPLADIAGHSHDGHYEAATADGTLKPVLTAPITRAGADRVESVEEFQQRVADDFAKTSAALAAHGVIDGLKHYTFPFTARTDDAVRLGQLAGFEYFYVGGERLVTPTTDRTAIPRVHAGAPEITAEVLKWRLDRLFAQP